MENLAVVLVHYMPLYCGWLEGVFTQEIEAVFEDRRR